MDQESGESTQEEETGAEKRWVRDTETGMGLSERNEELTQVTRWFMDYSPEYISPED